MAKYASKDLRNVAVVGHGATGKTSLCEALLFAAGKTDRLGRVDEGTSSMDFEPEEQKRHISIGTAVHCFEWDKHKINLIDTPGDSDFSFDTKSGLRVADSAVVVVDAVGGVEFQTEKVWGFAGEYGLPRLVFVNRMDRERANFLHAVEGIRQRLQTKPTPLFLPMGAEASFAGVVDLLAMKAVFFDAQKGAEKTGEIPPEMQEVAEKQREILVEDIAESDEGLMETYLEAGALSPEDLQTGLRKAVLAGTIVPVVAGSALRGIGVRSLMDLLVHLFPSPVDVGSLRGKHPATGETQERPPDPAATFSAFVFKTLADPYAGRLNLFRVYSGTLSADAHVYNASRRMNERFGSLFFLEGKNQKPTEDLIPGDIAAVAKLKETATGDTLCQEKSPIVFERVTPPPAVMSYAIEPRSRGDEEKIVSSVTRLTEEDPTLIFRRDEETKEMILSGMGQVHIEVSVEKMRRKFGVEVNLKIPKVPFKETIKGSAKGIQGRYKKQSGGRGQFGDTYLDIEPLPRGGGFEFVDRIVGGVIPQQYRPAVEKGIVEAMAEGVLAGYPIVDVRVSLVDGSYHTVDSSELAFKIAGSLGFKKGIMLCQPILLEPIVNMSIEIPDEYMGDVIGDLNSRRGRVMGMDARGNVQIIKTQIPLVEILKYAPDLRSMTSGRGTFTYAHSHYEEVPSHIAEKIIAESKKDEA